MERTGAALGRHGKQAGWRRSLAVGSFGVVSLVVLLASVRCANVDRGLGESCIRDEDCLSGVCAGQVCVAQPTVFDATVVPDASGESGPSSDAAPADATPDASSSPPPHDAMTPPVDAANDAPSNHDAKDAAPIPDASGVHDAHDAMSTPHDATSGTDATDAPAKSSDAAGEAGDAHPDSG